jgi:hypothetical protein
MFRSIWESLDYILERSVEGKRVVERCIEQAVAQFPVVCSNLVDANREPSQPTVKHQYDVWLVAASLLITYVLSVSTDAKHGASRTGIKKLLGRAYAVL